MASLFRTATMLGGKKSSKGVKVQLDRGGSGAAAGGSRRYTMAPRPQPRDSVLSNGSSDRSSSVSDETVLSPPSAPQDPGGYGSDILGFDAEEQIREAWPLKCCFVVKEIIQTEIAYVQALADIIKGYLTPLYSHLLNSGESPNFVKIVFSNIVKIHQSHQELVEGFQDTFSSPHNFASNFLRMDFLSLYSVYCTSFAQGNERLERALTDNIELREFIEHCQHELGHSLPLSSQLIKPVQRILKYRLLLEELNKHFDQKHPACQTVKAALEKMATVAEQINTSFSSQKGSSKGAPSAVAKKRLNQIRDLQRSRLHRGRQHPADLPLNSKLSHRSASESHLNFLSTTAPCELDHAPRQAGECVPPTKQRYLANHFPEATPGPDKASVMTRVHYTLPNGSVPCWSTSPPVSGERRLPGAGNPSSSPSHPGSGEDRRGLADSLPKVKQLKSYFEKLNKDGEEEASRRQSISQRPTGMRKARSMAGTKRDSINMVGLGSPSKSPPSWSPSWSPSKSPPTWSPSNSPIKVAVLPQQPASPIKHPTTTSSSSSSRSPTKSPARTALRPLAGKGSPTKVVSILAPSKPPHQESPTRKPRRPSSGSLSDLKVNFVVGGPGGVEKLPPPPQPANTRMPAATVASIPPVSKMGTSQPGANQKAKALAASILSNEIKKHIAVAQANKRGGQASAVPRTMV